MRVLPPENDSYSTAVVLFSAGKDSATSLAIARQHHSEVIPLFLDFGTEEAHINRQYVDEFFRHESDWPYSEYETIDLSNLCSPSFRRDVNKRQGILDDLLNREMQVEQDVPYIPMRTVCILAALAVAGDRFDADYLYWSFHQNEPLEDLDEDLAALPVAEDLVQMTAPPGYDPEFVNPLALCEHGSEVVWLGESYGVEWERTCSCLRQVDGHCWQCVSCQDRIEAFDQAGVDDPLYRK